MPCKVNHSQDWTFRIEQEQKHATTAHFITLTYSENEITRNDSGHGVLVKTDVQKFLKRLRKSITTYEQAVGNHLKFSQAMRFPAVKYYLCGEYGEESYRPHYHAIIFNVPLETLKQIEIIWNHGHVKVGTVTHASISYVTKYITKVDTRDLTLRDLTPPFNLMSKGLGGSYVSSETKEYHSRIETKLTIKKQYEQRLPKYYHDKVHDLSDFRTKLEIERYKKLKANAIQELEDAKYKELREKGVDLLQHDRQERQAIINKFNQNNKRKKL